MISPEQATAWTSFGTMIGLIAVAIRSEWRAVSVWKESKAEHETTQAAVVTTQNAVAKVESLVNGPLSVALKAAADFAEALARVTNLQPDIVNAIVARKLSDDHSAQTRAIAEFRSKIAPTTPQPKGTP